MSINVSGSFYFSLADDEVQPGEDYADALDRIKIKYAPLLLGELQFNDVTDEDDNFVRPAE